MAISSEQVDDALNALLGGDIGAGEALKTYTSEQNGADMFVKGDRVKRLVLPLVQHIVSLQSTITTQWTLILEIVFNICRFIAHRAIVADSGVLGILVVIVMTDNQSIPVQTKALQSKIRP